jgi:hypothetical protein
MSQTSKTRQRSNSRKRVPQESLPLSKDDEVKTDRSSRSTKSKVDWPRRLITASVAIPLLIFTVGSDEILYSRIVVWSALLKGLLEFQEIRLRCSGAEGSPICSGMPLGYVAISIVLGLLYPAMAIEEVLGVICVIILGSFYLDVSLCLYFIPM